MSDLERLKDRLKYKDDQIAYLWSLLDDISTAGDMFKPEIDGYFTYVNQKCQERTNVACSSNGKNLTINEVE